MLIRMSLQVQTHEIHAFMREEFMYVRVLLQYSSILT